jgi:hypothetical protein
MPLHITESERIGFLQPNDGSILDHAFIENKDSERSAPETRPFGVREFVSWNNHEHRLSATRYMNPAYCSRIIEFDTGD